jgi:ABC-type uncharacterized transport system involved in gliding motility auxiliary subunit
MDKGDIFFKLKSSSNLTAAILLVLILVVVMTMISERYYLRWDLTKTREHTLSEDTLQVLENVEQPITVKAFVRDGYPESEEAERLLSAYHYQVPHITYELIDPQKHPAIAQRFSVTSLNTFVLEGYGQSQTIKLAQEEDITNALLRLMEQTVKKVFWVTGHGERTFQGTELEACGKLHERLTKQNYAFQEINLMREDIPADAALVVVAAPRKPLFPEEVKSLRSHIHGGGRVILFLEPLNDGGLASFLASYGLRITEDIIVDKLSRVMGGNYLLPMLVSYADHEITRNFSLTCFFDMARSVEPAEEMPRHMTVTALALTSTNSWAETDLDSLHEGKVQFEETDRQGPISLAAIVELKPPIRKEGEGKESDEPAGGHPPITGEGRLAVFGDSDFISNNRFELAGNADLLLNTVNYLGGREKFITIKREMKPVEPLLLSRKQGMLVFWIPVVAIPLAVLVIGIVVWFRRRSR